MAKIIVFYVCLFKSLKHLLLLLCVCAADVLSKDSGECSICLEDLVQGETIARLACLCVYHKRYQVRFAL